jgi:hypothetical protein
VQAVLGAIWLALGLTACAGGESDTVGAINLTAPSGSNGEGSTGDVETTGGTGGDADSDATSDTSPTTDPTNPTDPSDPTTNPTDPTTDPSATSGPPLDCMFAEDCDDADACTVDNCVNSLCSNEPVDCDDSIECTIDSCDPVSGACQNTPDDTACDDGNACTGSETCSAATGCVPGDAVTCNDAQACTMDACDPATGMCSFNAIEACTSGDGCCPLGCSVADSDCTCTNLAVGATATSSGGGVDSTGYGPSTWVDGAGEASCVAGCNNQCFGWISNGSTPSGAWMQLQWPSTQVIGSMVIDGEVPFTCFPSFNRTLAGGTIQWWNGASWIDAQSFSGGSGNLEFSFDPPLETTRIRVYNVVAPAGGSNSLAFEWYVYEPLGCTP